MDETQYSATPEEIMRLSLFPEMIGGLAHELAQPLNAITLACEVMRLKIQRSGLSATEKEFFDVRLSGVKNQVSKSSSLIDQLRSFFSENDSNTGTTDILALLDEVVGLMGQQLTAKGINLNIKRPDEKITSGYSRRLLSSAIAQCMVFVRNRVEYLRKSSDFSGKCVNFDLSVEIETSPDKTQIVFKWYEEPDHQGGKELETIELGLGIASTRETIRINGGALMIDKGIIRLELPCK